MSIEIHTPIKNITSYVTKNNTDDIAWSATRNATDLAIRTVLFDTTWDTSTTPVDIRDGLTQALEHVK